MISICIPVYNFNITSLLNKLCHQVQSLTIPVEIIVIDDCSKNFQEINKKAAEKYNYVELTENIGRSKIRNLFIGYSKYEQLLFLDCDSLIIKDNFLQTYLDILKDRPGVVVGGRVYENNKPERNKMLRWKYGTFRESTSAQIRSRHPYGSFMTNNFLIKKEILEEIRFDERLLNYGHEDTLFGFSLKQENIPILHIENPVLNGDLETNVEYLEKTNEGVKNLVRILQFSNWDKDLINDISLLTFYYKIKKWKWMIYISFVVFKPFIVLLFKKGYIHLKMFDFYKLGLFIKWLKKKNK